MVHLPTLDKPMMNKAQQSRLPRLFSASSLNITCGFAEPRTGDWLNQLSFSRNGGKLNQLNPI